MKKIRPIPTAIPMALVVIGTLIGCQQQLSPPNTKIVGRVTDETTGEPVHGARVADNVYCGSPNRPCQEAWTDEDGRFVLETWYEHHSIVISAPGYPPTLDSLLTKNFKHEPEVEMNFSISKQTQ